MNPTAQKTMIKLQAAFVNKERHLRVFRGSEILQGLVDNLEDLQRALEIMTKATTRERAETAKTKANRKHM